MQTNKQMTDSEKLEILARLLDKANITICNVISTLVVHGKKVAQNAPSELNVEDLVNQLNGPLDAIAALQRLYRASAEAMSTEANLNQSEQLAQVIETLSKTMTGVPSQETNTHPWSYDSFCGEQGLLPRLVRKHRDDPESELVKIKEPINIRDQKLDYEKVQPGFYGVGTAAETLVLFDPTFNHAVYYQTGGDDPTAYVSMRGYSPISMKTMSRSSIGTLGIVIERIVNRYL